MKPIGIVDVWNSFVPDSNWDKDRQPGREGTQTVNVVVVCEYDEVSNGNLNDDGLQVDKNSEAGKLWAVEARRWISIQEALEKNMFDKYVRLNIERALLLGYL